MRWDRRVRNLGERNNRDSAPQLPFLEQRFAGLFVVDDDEKEAAASANFQRPVVVDEVGLDVKELADHALNSLPVEPAVWVGVLKVQAAELCPQIVQAVLRGVEGRLCLAHRLGKFHPVLCVDTARAKRRALLVDDALSERLFLRHLFAVLFALAQHLRRALDALLEVGNTKVFLLHVGIHLRQPRLRREQFLAKRFSVAAFGVLGRLLRRHPSCERLNRPLRLLDVTPHCQILLVEGIPLRLFFQVSLFYLFHLFLDFVHDRCGLFAPLFVGLNVGLAIFQF
mmetsp:Transcript_32329/g.89324  ORF Transcript_32329/g.89324 Transcript_32329/m.89324 type:complete len:283 (+) Transcript_32329:1935-2783(+)